MGKKISNIVDKRFNVNGYYFRYCGFKIRYDNIKEYIDELEGKVEDERTKIHIAVKQYCRDYRKNLKNFDNYKLLQVQDIYEVEANLHADMIIEDISYKYNRKDLISMRRKKI